ncbi:hypothetical protein L484_012517 [Morus notabilis]|uniref:Uncharacterized protein n=1 Tax=Morus notabilis TaxID=981085 RepID=W9QMG0_9ROSA|nr:hypothetical protein L484_012517 [Morus notabilis]
MRGARSEGQGKQVIAPTGGSRHFLIHTNHDKTHGKVSATFFPPVRFNAAWFMVEHFAIQR